jgi:hypothetical protein
MPGQTVIAEDPVPTVAEEPEAGAATAPDRDGGVTMSRLEDQLRWYDGKAKGHQRWYQRLKVVQIVIAAAIPVVAAFGAAAAVAGLLGALIVVVEGLQQLFQFQQNWLRYRGAAQSLEREKHLYLAAAGPYSDAPRPSALLAERLEGLLASEVSAWTSDQQEAAAAADRPQGG